MIQNVIIVEQLSLLVRKSHVLTFSNHLHTFSSQRDCAKSITDCEAVSITQFAKRGFANNEGVFCLFAVHSLPI